MEDHGSTSCPSFAEEMAFYRGAKPRFLSALKDAANCAGPEYFGQPDVASVNAATDKWQLCPQRDLIERAIGSVSTHEGRFLAAVYSIYNADDGAELLRDAGVMGLADLTGMDLGRQRILFRLIENYQGW